MKPSRTTTLSLLASAAIAGALCPIADAYAQTVSDRVLSDVPHKPLAAAQPLRSILMRLCRCRVFSRKPKGVSFMSA